MPERVRVRTVDQGFDSPKACPSLAKLPEFSAVNNCVSKIIADVPTMCVGLTPNRSWNMFQAIPGVERRRHNVVGLVVLAGVDRQQDFSGDDGLEHLWRPVEGADRRFGAGGSDPRSSAARLITAFSVTDRADRFRIAPEPFGDHVGGRREIGGAAVGDRESLHIAVVGRLEPVAALGQRDIGRLMDHAEGESADAACVEFFAEHAAGRRLVDAGVADRADLGRSSPGRS